jgi:hypothetical protein
MIEEHITADSKSIFSPPISTKMRFSVEQGWYRDLREYFVSSLLYLILIKTDCTSACLIETAYLNA